MGHKSCVANRGLFPSCSSGQETVCEEWGQVVSCTLGSFLEGDSCEFLVTGVAALVSSLGLLAYLVTARPAEQVHAV